MPGCVHVLATFQTIVGVSGMVLQTCRLPQRICEGRNPAVAESSQMLDGGSQLECPASRQQYRLAKQAMRVDMHLRRARQRIHTVVAAVECTKREEGRVCAVDLGKRLPLGGSCCPRFVAKVGTGTGSIPSHPSAAHLNSDSRSRTPLTLYLPCRFPLLSFCHQRFTYRLRRFEWVTRRLLWSCLLHGY